jgi:hypothetical protein
MGLEQLFFEQIKAGLERKTIINCSQWAKKYRVMGGLSFPGRFGFKYHPWQLEMHNSTAEYNIGQKAAQMGYTDTVLNVAFFTLDVKGQDVLYVLPTKTPDATDFSAGRFNPALELSPHLSNMFSDVQNIGHKRAGTRNLYVRGSRSRSSLKTLPIGTLILDEVDEMTQDNIPLVLERLSGQKEKRVWLLSTPTIEGMGINVWYQDSSQNHFFFPCPHCSRRIELQFPQNLKITGEYLSDPNLSKSHLICDECQHPLSHHNKYEYLGQGKWVETYNHPKKGWYINQLYSSTVSPPEIAALYFKSLENKADEQEFHNSKLGLTHEVKGAKLTERIIRETVGTHLEGSDSANKYITTMGIDQGKWLHYEIAAWQIGQGEDISAASKPTILSEGRRINFEDLDQLMIEYNINFAVIDSQPERRKATEFARRFPGRVRLCFYPEGMNTRQISLSSDGDLALPQESTVSVDRTTWLDTSLGRFYNKKISLPKDVSQEYVDHLTAITRIYKKDKNGNPIARYVTGSRPDHFAHARNYCEIALPLAVMFGKNESISEW